MFKVIDKIAGLLYEAGDKQTHKARASALKHGYAMQYGRKNICVTRAHNLQVITLRG